MNIKNLLKILILLFFYEYAAMGQNSYKTKYNQALFVEALGVSPFASFNFEQVLSPKDKSFWALRAGLGYVGGSQKPNVQGKYDNGVSIPIGLGYNFLINNLKKNLKARMSAKCNPNPPRFAIETFGEIGLVNTTVITNVSEPKNFIFTTFGLRNQIIYGHPSKPKVLFIRIYYNPYWINRRPHFYDSVGPVFLAGGSIGFSIK